MQSLSFPIRLNQSGAAVANLHLILLYLLKRLSGLKQPDSTQALSPKEQLQLILLVREEQAGRLFGSQTLAAIRLIQFHLGLSASGEIDERSASVLNKKVEDLGGFTSTNTYCVEGLVFQAAGIPLAATVKALDKNLREDTLLGDSKTNAIGFYEIHFAADQFTKSGKTGPDLYIRVEAAGGNETSGVRNNAGRLEEIDWVAGGTARVVAAPEFQRLNTVLSSRLGTVRLADLKKDNQQDDFGWLAQQTGESESYIRLLSDAHRLVPIGVSPELVFAALAGGLTGTPQDLYAQREQLSELVARAAQDGLIAPRTPQDINTDLVLIRGAAFDFLLKGNDSMPGLESSLEAAGLNIVRQRKFTNLLLDHEGTTTAFWEKIEVDNQLKQFAPTLRFELQVAEMIGHHQPMAGQIRQLKQNEQIQSTRDLARISPTDWKNMVQVAGFPAEVPGDSPEEKQQAYVDGLMASVEATYPSEFYTARLLEKQAVASPVRQFLTKNVWERDEDKALKIHAESLDSWLSRTPDAFDGFTPEEQSEVRRSLHKIIRLHRLGGTASDALALDQLGYSSAQGIAFGSSAGFVARHAATLGAENSARIYRKASQIKARTLGVVTEFSSASQAQPRVIRQEKPTATSWDASTPVWQDLFGSMDQCQVPDCLTAYGAPAYLTDVFHFLDARKNGGRSALDVLFDRRPDLKHLALSCENTETVLPYIDLVNELLELTIAPPLTGEVVLPYQTGGTTEARIAQPEYIRSAAYEPLKTAAYPWSLPFDVNRETLIQCFKQIDLEQITIQESLWMGKWEKRWEHPALAFEYLGLSQVEAAIIISNQAESVWEYWGYSAEILPDTSTSILWYSTLAQNIQELMRRSGLFYDELLQLLDTRYVNPETTSSAQRQINFTEDITSPACDKATMQLTGLDDIALDRLMRFVRLWRKLGWSVQDTDRAVRVLGNNSIDENCLVKIAQLKRIQNRTKLSMEDLLVWWGQDITSYFKYTPRGPVVIPSWYDKFISGQDAPVPFAEAAVIHRRSTVSQAMQINLEELEYWIKWTHADPFGTPAEALLFFEQMDTLRQAGFTVYDLRFLLQDSPVGNQYTEIEKSITVETILKNFKAALGEALANAKEFVLVNNPELSAEEQEEKVAQGEQVEHTKQKVFRQTLADLFGLSVPSVQLVNTSDYTEDPITLEALARILSRISWVARNFNADDYVLSYGMLHSEISLIHLLNLEKTAFSDEVRRTFFKKWVEMARWINLQRVMPGMGRWLTIQDSNGTFVKEAVVDGMSQAWNWKKEEVEDILTAFEAYDVQPSPRHLQRLLQVVVLLRKTGLTWEQLQGLDQSQAAINMLRQHYDDTQWLHILEAINNPLRERRRDAMLAYLLAHPPVIAIRDANDLYMHLLIDVEMSAAQLTSRLKQAIGSTQLFVQRCLLGLEAELIPTLGDPDWEQWKWMKNYRVWEANRKVFLYPENWIEPELRDDKSPFFKELENEILQNEITDANVEQVVRNYLNKLDAVSRLDIMAEYHENEDANGKPADILHVFGRTPSVPHQYYYRRHLNKTVWTPWEKIEADIEGNHLIPVIWNQRLHLFWPVFTEKQVETNVVMPTSVDPMKKGTMYKEVGLAWSEYRNGTWMAKKMSEEKIKPIITVNDKGEHLVKEGFWLNQDMSRILFTAYDDQAKGVVIHMMITSLTSNNQKIRRFIKPTAQNAQDGLTQHGSGGIILTQDTSSNPAPILDPQFPNTKTAYFYFQECGDNTDVLQLYNNNYFEPLGYLTPSSQLLRNSKIINSNPDSGLYLYSDNTKNLRTILKHVPNRSLGSIAFLVQDSEFNPKFPFFYQNKKNTFYVGTQKPGGVYWGRSQARASALIPNKGSAFGEILNRSTFFYKFTPHYHPYSCDFLRRLGAGGFEQLLTLQTQQQQSDFNFETTYKPQYVAKPYPVENVTLDMNGAYSLYNWELFFHIPMMVADRLSKNQRFEEAMRWFHFVFNPLNPAATDADNVSRNWQFRRFAELAETGDAMKRLEAYLNPSNPNYAETQAAIRQWRNNPFKPHLVARWRNSAYMRHVVMRYLDNLIAWGDELFRRDTLETINEATQLYVLAAEILGEKPRLVAPRKAHKVYSFTEIRNNLDDFSIFTQVENSLLEDIEDETASANEAPPSSWSQIFVLSPNDKLLGYWDTVADRLFKIRHSMNIGGQVRQLPLFEPPIDPALLVRATAAGLDISTALGEIVFAPAVYRYAVLSAKASELAAEVRGLGTTLLSAIEKRDAEGLTMLRSGQEIRLLEAVRDVKIRQVSEAKEQVKSIEWSIKTVEIRENFYDGRLFMNPGEGYALLLGAQSLLLKNGASVHEATAKILAALGDFKFGSPTTVGMQNGPRSAANALKHAADQISADAAILDNIGSLILTTNSYVRRKEDWNLQSDLAKSELKQLNRQLIAAQIRLAIAEQDLRNHDRQTENAREADEYMRSKFTNLQLYDWMTSQVAAMYFQAYNMAFRLAKQAESAMKLELGLEHNTEHIIKTSYWDSLKKGLLSGDLLYQDIKRLEAAYLERNTRELELSKHISLNQLNPFALLQLREEGICKFAIPEELFDLDFPGHYMRRIKSVSITIPCVAGPYTSINATLRLKKSSTRVKASAGNGYPRSVEGEDDRFRDQFAGVQSIATSSAQNDSGLFELNFRDERYLPFEGAGAISEWTLEMMTEPSLRQFDYNTIADVVVHLRYTAREDGGLKTSAVTHLKGLTDALGGVALKRLFSLRHDFPNEWHLWAKQGKALSIKLEKHHFPYFAQMGNLTISEIKAYEKGNITIFTAMNVAGDANTGWIITGGTLDAKKDDYFLLVPYQI